MIRQIPVSFLCGSEKLRIAIEAIITFVLRRST